MITKSESKALLRQLREIHSNVFRNFTYLSDKLQYGKSEHWVSRDKYFTPNTKFTGDCEDFALACRFLCRKANIHRTRLVFCYCETGEGHCVLECNGYILDNRYETVEHRTHRQFAGYKWVAMSGFVPGDPWHEIAG